MSQRSLVLFVIAANLLIVIASFLMFGWNGMGAHIAARWSARFSVLIFIVAFAQLGLSRWIASLPAYATLVHTFVAAHCVHFAAVVTVLFLDKENHFARNPRPASAIIGIGFTLVVVAAVTAGLRTSIAYRVLHGITIYALFAIFMLAFVRHHLLPLRAIAVLLGLALIVRISGAVQGTRSSSAPNAA